jgi:hypothetical protein
MRNTIIGTTVICSLLLTGCVFAPGSDSHSNDRPARVEQPTICQQLMDLDRALDAGVINQS